jgi:hypothetical protein
VRRRLPLWLLPLVRLWFGVWLMGARDAKW